MAAPTVLRSLRPHRRNSSPPHHIPLLGIRRPNALGQVRLPALGGARAQLRPLLGRALRREEPGGGCEAVLVGGDEVEDGGGTLCGGGGGGVGAVDGGGVFGVVGGGLHVFCALAGGSWEGGGLVVGFFWGGWVCMGEEGGEVRRVGKGRKR